MLCLPPNFVEATNQGAQPWNSYLGQPSSLVSKPFPLPSGECRPSLQTLTGHLTLLCWGRGQGLRGERLSGSASLALREAKLCSC